MTSQATMPHPPAPQAARDGFAQIVRAEWTKLRTVRGWVIGLVVAALVTAAIGLLTAAGGSSSCQAAGGGPARSGRACGPTYPVGPAGEPVTDSFYFVRQPLTGSGSITVRVTSLTGRIPPANGHVPLSPDVSPDTRPGLVPWAKAGVIIKAGTRPGSPYAAMMVTATHGVRLQANYTSDTAGRPGAVSAAAPRWLRLTRFGATVTGYDSADGTHWTEVGSVQVPGLPATVQAGLFTASPAYQSISSNFGGGTSGSILPSQATGVFDHVGRTGRWPAGSWTGDYIDAGGGSGVGGYHQAGGRYRVTGSGDIAPVIAGSDSGGPQLTLTNLLAGTFAGLIGVLVVAAMFITAEYRRGLIRTTLTASPRRGRVLAAKALVVGAVSFVAGLAAATVAVTAGAQIAQHKAYVFPTPWTTELRVIVGTAALLAVAAVLALALGAVLRRGAAAVTILVVAFVLPYLLSVASVLPVGVLDWLLRITPAAAFAVQQAAPRYSQVTALYSPGTGYFPLAPWAGFAVLCAWAALIMGLAVVMMRRRDA